MGQNGKEFSTWYEATAARGAARPWLAGKHETDVCIVGGGLAGLVTALELARAGKRVALLEAKRIAWGASGRNGGFVSDGFAEGIEAIEKKIGLPAARALYSLSRLGTEWVRAEASPMGQGMLVALRHSGEGALAKYRDHMNRYHGTELTLLSTDETRTRLSSRRYHQALYNAKAFHIHPLRYALDVAREAKAQGALVFEDSPALNVSGNRVTTAQGEIKAAHVVIAVSSLDRKLHRRTGRALLPVATYIAVTEPIAEGAVNTCAAIADTRRAGNYYRLIDGKRLLWGGAITTRVSAPYHLAERMKRDMLSVYPQFGNPTVDFAWAGVMGYARHKMPLIGRGADGIWYATAFGGHGLNTTAMAGVLLARAIAHGDDEFRRFEAYRPTWAGGPFGRIGVQGAYWAMQLKDRFDERKRS